MDQIPFHDQQEVYGVSEDCKFNDHTFCRSPRCSCSCHRQAAANRNGTITTAGVDSTIRQPIQTGLDKYCPKCKVKAPSEQNYCTIDGSKLSSLRCPECGTPGDDIDNFCGYCGCSMKASDSQLEAAATGSRVAEDQAEISVSDYSILNNNDAEARMEAAMAARTKVKTVPAPAKISIGMFK